MILFATQMPDPDIQRSSVSAPFAVNGPAEVPEELYLFFNDLGAELFQYSLPFTLYNYLICEVRDEFLEVIGIYDTDAIFIKKIAGKLRNYLVILEIYLKNGHKTACHNGMPVIFTDSSVNTANCAVFKGFSDTVEADDISVN